MALFDEGVVEEITEESSSLVRARVKMHEGEVDVIGFPTMIGPLNSGDRVIVNTTGIALGLGTGSVGFVLWNLSGAGPPELGPGHILKMRYTPWQQNILAVEAPESPHHEVLHEATSLAGLPVIVCSLHSQIAAAAAGVKAANSDLRVGYLMTDGGALPLAWSDLVRVLKDAGLVEVTTTCGHAFGGDLEAVNVYTGLLALKWVAGADVVIAAMGPGVVGTDTALGHTAVEQGQIADAVTAIDGRPVAVLRLSFSDARRRHHGVSHHTLSALGIAARARCTVALPTELEGSQAELVRSQLGEAGIDARHSLEPASGEPGLDLLRRAGIAATTMTRGPDTDPTPFWAAAAAGALAASLR